MSDPHAHAVEQVQYDFKRDQRLQREGRICEVALKNREMNLKQLGSRFSLSPMRVGDVLKANGIVRGKDGWERGG